MDFTNEQKDILKILVQHELDFYEEKEETYEEDVDYVTELMKIYTKLGGK